MKYLVFKILLTSFACIASCATKEPVKTENPRVFVYNIANNKFELPNGRDLNNPQLIEYDIAETGWSKYTDKNALEILNTYKRVR